MRGTSDRASLMRSNQAGWAPMEFCEIYMQLTAVEKALGGP
jgi:hypothetical protein